MNTLDTLFTSVKQLLGQLPPQWLNLTTHRLDIYHEEHAKTEFLTELKKLLISGDYSSTTLEQLPTAYDYIRLGHQLSSVLEWLLAQIYQLADEQVIAFASHTMPLLSVLRTNKLAQRQTLIYYAGEQSPLLDEDRLKKIYGYQYSLTKINAVTEIAKTPDATVIFVSQKPFNQPLPTSENMDICVNIHPKYGSVMLIHNSTIENIVADVQHVRRRETIAMTPANCLNLLQEIVGIKTDYAAVNTATDSQIVTACIQQHTGSELTPLIASSGLSMQYAMLMGVIEHAMQSYAQKPIKILLPPNCYGGTNDQCRRIAALIPQVGIVDMPVDGGQDLVSSLDMALQTVAEIDAVALVLAEIPTNPRVEVPDMPHLAQVLTKTRFTPNQQPAIQPIFMVDQTFCPNVSLLHQHSDLHWVKTVSFTSGSKFPSGGRCIAGYCAVNNIAAELLPRIEAHLLLANNQANAVQLHILATQMPSMLNRIQQAYAKTREFVDFIHNLLPQAKIFYVDTATAQHGFMPSVFSLDLPASGDSVQQRQHKQRQLNLKLIQYMIKNHPQECKNCVSYGQLKGTYWTIPATSTQGTTKQEDKDYVVRIALSAHSNATKLCQSFAQFCQDEKLI